MNHLIWIRSFSPSESLVLVRSGTKTATMSLFSAGVVRFHAHFIKPTFEATCLPPQLQSTAPRRTEHQFISSRIAVHVRVGFFHCDFFFFKQFVFLSFRQKHMQVQREPVNTEIRVLLFLQKLKVHFKPNEAD